MKQVSIALAPLASLPPPSHLSSYILSLSCLAEGKPLIGVETQPPACVDAASRRVSCVKSFISPVLPRVCGKNLAMGGVSTLLGWAQEVGFLPVDPERERSNGDHASRGVASERP